MPDRQGQQPADRRVVGLPELRHLRYFVTVAEELNVTRAAEQLLLTQPALSRQIRALENLLGVALLVRGPRGLSLTPAGIILLERSRDILQRTEQAVTAVRAVASTGRDRARSLWTETADEVTLEELRTAYEQLLATSPLPDDVTIRPANAGGVPGLWLEPRQWRGTVLYVHGGAFMLGSAYGYRGLAGRLALDAGARVLVLDTGLAPERPYPTAPQEVLDALRWHADVHPDEPIALAADSAGLSVTLSALLFAAPDDPVPSALVAFSPWVDLVLGDRELRRRMATEASLGLEQLARGVEAYLAGNLAADDPRVNPLARRLEGLPPVLVQAGSGEAFLTDAQRLTDHLRRNGVDVQLQVFDAAPHVFHLFWDFLDEGADALRRAGFFLRGHLKPSVRSARPAGGQGQRTGSAPGTA